MHPRKRCAPNVPVWRWKVGVPACSPCRARTASGTAARSSRFHMTGPRPANRGPPRPTVCSFCATSDSTLVAGKPAPLSGKFGRTAAGRRAANPSLRARWSPASMARQWPSGRTSARTSAASSSGSSASNSLTAAGTARRSGGPCARHLQPPSTCWRGSWNMSGAPAALRNPLPPASAARSTCCNVRCSGARALGNSWIRTGSGFPIRPAGSMTRCALLTTSGTRTCRTHADLRTAALTRPSGCSAQNGARMAPGCSRTPTPAASTSPWRMATDARADGIRFGHCGCSDGTTAVWNPGFPGLIPPAASAGA